MPSLRENIQFGEGKSYRLIRWNGNIGRVSLLVSPDHVTEIPSHGAHWHYHRAMELTLMKRGHSTCFVADHIKRFEPDELLVLGENVPHYWHQPTGSAGISIQWDFPLEHGIWSFDEAKDLLPLGQAAMRGLHIRGKTAELTNHRMEEMAALGGIQRLAVFLKLLHGLATAPSVDVNLLLPRPFDLHGIDEHGPTVQRAVSYIHANYRDPINLSDLLALTGMSRTTFTRQFQEHTQKSFSAFMNDVRLQAVCRELQHTTKSVGNIAMDHGFNHLSFFNRLFRRKFGVCPTDYRSSART